jgi:hypothetical protein
LVPVKAFTDGRLFTVKEDVVLLQPVAVSAKVNVKVPAATPVTRPLVELIVPIAVLLLLQVPPVVGESVVVDPMQTEEEPLSAGNAFTVIARVTVVVQPLPLVTA